MRLCRQTQTVNVHGEERMNLQKVMKKVNLQPTSSMCPFLMILSWVELAAREVHVPVHFNGQERADESHSPWNCAAKPKQSMSTRRSA